ncbi:MAG: D-alanyl-D-alanine carboxypeptidase/D-alanyl-D-alanine-endopeptidase [Parachlamydiales bacterium]|nr:D-alanyl-D-alanine carboxypeptidase/D-alanyl-D-alanine-endopeptidase [Candidatus Acheromyda pituitae]
MITHLFAVALLAVPSLSGEANNFSGEMLQVMNQTKFEHAFWGVYVKDLETGKVLYELNADKLFSPASTTKLFSVAALLQTFGDKYRFKTPIYATNAVKNGVLEGDLVLVAQGDLTMGGRQSDPNTISFTKLDHINANEVPGTILTKEDPLQGINNLAKQVYQNGLRVLKGNVIIDDSLFETTEKRGVVISPIMINENLIDIMIDAGSAGGEALLTSRPQVPGYQVENQVKTVSADGLLEIEVSSQDGHHIVVKGTVPANQKGIVRTFAVQDPSAFARAALIQALKNQGIKIELPPNADMQQASSIQPKRGPQVALLTSPPLSEYGKLILKVSHNTGANLVPLLLASKRGQKTFNEGMRLLGDFTINKVGISPDAFVFIDGAGGNENRLTPQAEIQLLQYMSKLPAEQFQRYLNALPILGVNGSLQDFGKNSNGAGKVYAKTGTGAAFNLATGKFFLITQAYAGYIKGKNGHLYAYEVVVNNAQMPTINDIFAIFEDEAQLSSMIYDHTGVE